MKNIIALATGLQIFCFIVLANAEEVGGITGQLKDHRGRPVSNAKVSIGGKSDFTDDEGQYRIKGLAAGKYKVQVKTGARRLEDDIEIKNTVVNKDLSVMQLKPPR